MATYGVVEGRQQSAPRRVHGVGTAVGAGLVLGETDRESACMGQVWKLLRAWADERPGGMHDSQIARAVGVKPQVVAKWKAGTRPGPENLERIASVTGIDLDELRAAVLDDLGYRLTGGGPQGPAPDEAPVVEQETGT